MLLTICQYILNSFHASSDLSSTENFPNSLDPDQDPQNVHPDVNPNCLTFLTVFLKEFVEKVNSEKSQQMTTKA